MPAPTFHVPNHSQDTQSHGQGVPPFYGHLSFGSHNLQATQTAILGTHNLSQSCRNSGNFNFNTNKPVTIGTGMTGMTTTTTTTPPITTAPHPLRHHPHVRNFENVLENLELNNASSPTRKTSHNFNFKSNSSDIDKQQKTILAAYGKNENSPKLLPENLGIPYTGEELSNRLTAVSPQKSTKEIKSSRLSGNQGDIHLNCILSTPELPPKIHLGKKSPVYAKGSGETLFHFDSQKIHRMNSSSQDGHS